MPYCFLGSSIKFQGHTGWKIDDLNPIWVRLLGRSQLSNPSDLPCSFLDIYFSVKLQRINTISLENILNWYLVKLQLYLRHTCFLAATKHLYKWYFPSVCPSVRLSVRLSHLFDYVLLNVSSWNFQELLLMTKVRSMQKVKVRGQRSRSQRSQPNLTVSGL